MFLTTHYMEEADRLCGRLAIIDQGRIVASGSPAELKRSISTERVRSFVWGSTAWMGWRCPGRSRAEPRRDASRDPHRTHQRRRGPVRRRRRSGHRGVLRCLDGGRVRVTGLSTEKPSLDDVFLNVTGRRIRSEAADQPINLGWM